MRMSFAQVFVNDIYYGMYTLAEEPDRDWIAARYTSDNFHLLILFLSFFTPDISLSSAIPSSPL